MLALLSMPARALDCSTIKNAAIRATVCRVDVRNDPLRLFLRDDAGTPFKSFDAIDRWLIPRGRHLVFAMNAGMFRRDFSPLGLSIAAGRQLTGLETRSSKGNFFLKPNGVFLVSDRGARVMETSEYALLREHVILATQSGPLLLHAGKLHPALRPRSKSRLIRNGVGVTPAGEVLFVIADSPLNFYEFALLFRDTLHCRDALYLDGNVSSLKSLQLGRDDHHHELGPIIGLTDVDR
jgi:uncharacterized protein YigE (DUF2233 family)